MGEYAQCRSLKRHACSIGGFPKLRGALGQSLGIQAMQDVGGSCWGSLFLKPLRTINNKPTGLEPKASEFAARVWSMQIIKYWLATPPTVEQNLDPKHVALSHAFIAGGCWRVVGVNLECRGLKVQD